MYFPENRQSDALYVADVVVHWNEMRTNYTSEKTNILFQDYICIPYSSYSVSFKDIEEYVAMQIDACLNHQTSATIMVDVFDIGG